MNVGSKPTVSVIIPTHSRPHYLPRAVESARAAGTNIEIVVVDDASTDETAGVCRKLDGIKYVRLERNQGVAGARNVGILASSADKIAFLDDDDLRLPDSLDWQKATLDSNPEAGFVCGAMMMADDKYEPTGEISTAIHSGGDAFWELLELAFPVMPLSVMVRKECFLRVGLLNRRLPGIDDWDIFVRIAELYPVIVMDQPVGLYRKPQPSSDQGSSAQASQLFRALQHQLNLLQLPRVRAIGRNKRREIRRRTVNRVIDTLLLNAVRQLPAREYRFVYANVSTALRLNPLRVARLALSRRWPTRVAEHLHANHANKAA